jgi:hypothetical protein
MTMSRIKSMWSVAAVSWTQMNLANALLNAGQAGEQDGGSGGGDGGVSRALNETTSARVGDDAGKPRS